LDLQSIKGKDLILFSLSLLIFLAVSREIFRKTVEELQNLTAGFLLFCYFLLFIGGWVLV
jgi:hypothetical protein